VEANQIADNFYSLGLGTIENDYFNDQETPNNVTCPPHSLDFYYEHDGKTFDEDTSADVAKLCDLEMRNRSANLPKHGATIRYLSKWSFNPTSIGRNSVKRRMLFGIANAHTRMIRKSKPYAVLHEMKRTGDLGIGYHPTDKQALKCPFCEQPFYHRGNTRHLHVFCEGVKLKATRQSYYGILEKKLEEMNTLSNEIIERCSNNSTAPSLLDCMREFLREDELATFKTDA